MEPTTTTTPVVTQTVNTMTTTGAGTSTRATNAATATETVVTATTTTTSVTLQPITSIIPSGDAAGFESSLGTDFEGFEDTLGGGPLNQNVHTPPFISEAINTIRNEFRVRTPNTTQQSRDREVVLSGQEIMRTVDDRVMAIMPGLIRQVFCQMSWCSSSDFGSQALPAINQQQDPFDNTRQSINNQRAWNTNSSASFNIPPRINQQSRNLSLPPLRNNPVPDLSVPPPPFHQQTRSTYAQPPQPTQQVPTFTNQQQTFNYPISLTNQQPPRQNNNYQNHGIDKWGLEFDGTNKTPSVEDFVFRVETLQAYFRVSWADILKNMHHFLRKAAHDWLWDYRRMNPNVNDWFSFKRALVKYFHKYESDFEIQRKILDRRQQHNESFDEFCNSVLHLRNQQNNPIPEQDLVDIMKGNLKPAMMQLLFAVRPIGFDHFRAEARRAENMLNNQRSLNPRFHNRQVNELVYDPAEVEEEILEISAINKERVLVCWNCKQNGHTFVDCPVEQRRIFCYRCGLENVVSPKCPMCAGNRSVNGPRSGTEVRSRNPMTQFQQTKQE